MQHFITNIHQFVSKVVIQQLQKTLAPFCSTSPHKLTQGFHAVQFVRLSLGLYAAVLVLFLFHLLST